VPERFGRYRVIRTLGVGGMGEVYEAVDEALDRPVAVKTLKTASGLAAQILDERFRHEARAIARLSHPNIVAVFDIDLAADPPYLVMELVAGTSLAKRIAAGPPLTTPELVTLGIQIARALAAAHAVGIVHRDVKPANVLAAGDGAWKLADFGVARVPDSSLTMTGQFVGSPAYAPPEALVRGDASSAGDVYGLAALLYEAAAARWPRAEASRKGALLAPTPPLRELAPHVEPAVAAAIDRALSLDPDARPTATELADALAGSSSPHVAPAVETVALPAPPHARNGWKWLVGAGALLAAIAIAAFASRTSSKPAAAATGDVAPALPPTPQPPDPQQPPVLDKHAAKDWQKIADDVRRGHYEPARHHLEEFEERYGETPESRALRDQLDALPEHDRPPGPPGRGKGKHRDED
jgi:serine/threonine protein kinase